MNGPTKNSNYNAYVKKYSKDKKDYRVRIECEGCQCSLLNKEVFDNKFGWLCKKCHKNGFSL